jgi:hypothetical protein
MLLLARFRYRMAWLSDLGTLATRALHRDGLTWSHVMAAVGLLAFWGAAFVVVLVALLGVIR